MNLLDETIEILQQLELTKKDISFIGFLTNGQSCTWKEFTILADKDYENGYGTAEVNLDLIIGFHGGDRLQRAEYDGSEGWDYIGKIPTSKNLEKITTLFIED
jgi:hypothetical protein